MKKFLDSDWLRAIQFQGGIVQEKKVTQTWTGNHDQQTIQINKG